MVLPHPISTGDRTSISESQVNIIKISLFLFVVFATFAHTIGDNENSRFDTTISIVEDHNLSINKLQNNTGDKSFVNGNHYSDKAPLASFLAVPSFFIIDSLNDKTTFDDYYLDDFKRSHTSKIEWGRFAATVSVSALAGTLVCVFLYLISLKMGLEKSESVIISLFSGLGTLIFPYSTTFHGTISGTFFLVAAVYLWIKDDLNFSYRNGLLASLLIGLGVSGSYLIAIPGGVLLSLDVIDRLKDYKKYVILLTGLIIGLSPLLIYNYLTTGNPFLPTVMFRVVRGFTQRTSLEGVKVAYGSPGGLIIRASASSIRTLFSPLNGLFLYFPTLIFGVFGLRHLYEKKKLLLMVLGSLFCSLIFISLIPITNIRAFFGPRYLLPSATLLIIPLALELKSSKKFEKSLIYLSGLLSIILTFSSTQPWIGKSYVLPVGRHFEKMVNLGIYENRIFEYITSIYSNGLQSPIISHLLSSSNEFSMVLSSYSQNELPIGRLMNRIVLYDIRFLTLALLGCLGILLFRKNFKKINQSSLKYSIILIIIMIFLGFQTSSSPYMHQWYDQKPDESYQWGKENPQIHLISKINGEQNLTLEARSYEKRNVEIELNNDVIMKIDLSQKDSKFSETVSIKEGLNVLEFETGRCNVIGRFENNTDYRCVTIGLKEFRIS